MSEYLIDENKNLVPYSEPSGSLPVVTVSFDITSNVSIYCNDYGNGGDYMLCVILSGRAEDTTFFRLYGCMSGENSAYLVAFVGTSVNNFPGGQSTDVRLWLHDNVTDPSSSWNYWYVNSVLNDTRTIMLSTISSVTYNNATFVFRCIKLW